MDNITEQEIRDAVDIEKIKEFIGAFKFGRNGACDTIAEMIGKDINKLGGLESFYYDCLESVDIGHVRFLFERRVTANNGVPHRIIELFEATEEMRYIGKIDLPYELYESCTFKGVGEREWSINSGYTNITKDDLKIELCEPKEMSPTLAIKLGMEVE